MDFVSDLDFILTDAGGGATIALGGVSVPCIVNEQLTQSTFGQREIRAHSIGTERFASFKTGSLPGVRMNAIVTVTRDGVATQYEVRNLVPVDEGAMTRAYLKDV